MKRIQSISIFLLVSICLILNGCTSQPSTADTITSQTVDNPFTQPTNSPETSESPTETEAIEDPSFTGYSGNISHGYTDKSLTNENGLYHLYTGGELHINYSISTTGNLGDAGIGILLILDGQPQPYKTAKNDEYRYVHTFYPSAEKKMTVELILTPVTGKEGDTLELTAFHILGPDYYPNEQVIGMMQTNGSVWSSTQLVFQATPPIENQIEVTDRIISQTIESTDLTSDDIKGWSSEDLNSEYAFTFVTDHDADAANIYGISQEKNLIVHTEVFGATSVEWSLIIYVDHKPVSVLAEHQMNFSTQNGQKTIIETVLAMDDFNGESIIYAVLFARNWRDPAVINSTNCTTEITSTYYLTDAKNLADMDLKYGRTK